jgi:drug/metabolite transporter (DMT)-like permease
MFWRRDPRSARWVRRLFILAFIWGWSFLFIKVAGEGLTPTTVAWARIALGAAVLYAVLHSQGRRIPRDRTSLRHYALVTLAGNIVPFTLLAWGEQHITSALTAVLNASTPLFTALFAAIGLGERLRPVQIAGLALGVVGVAVAATIGG